MYQSVSPILASCLNIVNLAEMLLKQNSSAGWLPDFSDYKPLMTRNTTLRGFSIHDHVPILTPSSLTEPAGSSFPCLPCYQCESSGDTHSAGSSTPAISIAPGDVAVIVPTTHPVTEKPYETCSSKDSRVKASKSNHSPKKWLAMSHADAELAATALVVNTKATPPRKTMKLWKSALKSVKIMISHTKDQVLHRQCSRCQVVHTPNSYQNLHRSDAQNGIPHRRKPRLVLNMKSIRKAEHDHLRQDLKQRISSYRSRRQVKGRST